MVRVISLSDEAYEKLKAEKAGRSFSETVLGLIERKPKKNIMEFFGKWSGGKDELDRIEKMLEEDRKRAKTRDVKF